ncbi:MAG TPA: dihydroorotate dehydrogenase electron transfer subunit [Steroidobacteraceae bacterium]|nr:dihydroorotate dehydrogenase electron transfer subunit [Steroidobacteraceae bacterium]
MSPAPVRPHRGSIFLEQSVVLAHAHFAGDQHVLRLQAPRCAARAQPGSFVHVRCAQDLPMRRPMSIMRAHAEAGWIELLYKVVGVGSRALARLQPGDTVSALGPIGRGFEPQPARPRVLALGGGVGIPPMVFLAERLLEAARPATAPPTSPAPPASPASPAAPVAWKPLVLMGSEVPFPFRVRPSTLLVPGMPDEAIGCMPLLEEWGVPSRLASLAGLPGCFEGYVTELARAWLAPLAPEALAEVEVFACGPTPMLAACARLAREFAVPCQVSLEEFMACAVGGCAGCAVAVRTPEGSAMRRVCVDGPVFEAQSIFG